MKTKNEPVIFSDLSSAAKEILNQLGANIQMAAPLGLGKPNSLINLLYSHAKNNPSTKLNIFTALSLNPPDPSEDLAKRFFVPFAEKHWGTEYPKLEYSLDAEKDRLPKNVKIHEFYFRAGSALQSEALQKDYQSINYTHVAEAVHQAGVNLIVVLIAKTITNGHTRYSLSCNPDVTLDLNDLYQESNSKLLKVAVIHSDLPFLGGDAEVNADFFDIIVEDSKVNHELFALPRMPIDEIDHTIGFYASQMIADDGTLQVGIGSLSDAVVSALLMRHQKNSLYQKISKQIWRDRIPAASLKIETTPFTKGLYGLSEMVTDGYMHLRRAGILNREVIDEKSGTRTYLHGAFYLGSKEFYSWLRNLKNDDFTGLRMTRVSKVNDLYDPNETVLRLQRKNPRFLNTCMQVTLLGGAASETLEDGKVVSGVGGQYNFVAMASELKNSRSILMLRSTREHNGKITSNVVWSHSQQTIPRHLRDIVITEYGIADLRNKTDEECIISMIEIADAKFQMELVSIAKKNGKISKDYEIPSHAKLNTLETLQECIAIGKKDAVFNPFPLGSDFTPIDEKLVLSLQYLQSVTWNKIKIISLIIQGLSIKADSFESELERMQLRKPKSIKEYISKLLLQAALEKIKKSQLL